MNPNGIDLDMLPCPLPPEIDADQIVRLHVSRKNNDRIIRVEPPVHPGYALWVEDEDGDLRFVREMTLGERFAVDQRYEYAMRDWKKTGGFHRTKGPVTWEAEVDLADYTRFELIGDGRAWFVTSEERVF